MILWLKLLQIVKYDKNYGARPLRRKIQELVEDRLSEEILQENIVRGKEFIFKL